MQRAACLQTAFKSTHRSKVKHRIIVHKKTDSLKTRALFLHKNSPHSLNPCSSDFESNTTLSELANNFVENETLRTHPFRLENFSYKNNIVMNTLFKHMESTSFRGVTVRWNNAYLQIHKQKNSSASLASIVAYCAVETHI